MDEAVSDITWLAIRQPAVIRFLERELASTNGDAFAAGLELACRLLGGRNPLVATRLSTAALLAGLAAVRFGDAVVGSLQDDIEALPVALSPVERDDVVTAIGAVMWALDASAGNGDDALVA